MHKRYVNWFKAAMILSRCRHSGLHLQFDYEFNVAYTYRDANCEWEFDPAYKNRPKEVHTIVHPKKRK